MTEETFGHLLLCHPRAVFKSELRRSNFGLEEVYLLSKLSNCVQWCVVLKWETANLQMDNQIFLKPLLCGFVCQSNVNKDKGESAYLVVDESCDGFDFQQIGVMHPQIQYVTVCLPVMSGKRCTSGRPCPSNKQLLWEDHMIFNK